MAATAAAAAAVAANNHANSPMTTNAKDLFLDGDTTLSSAGFDNAVGSRGMDNRSTSLSSSVSLLDASDDESRVEITRKKGCTPFYSEDENAAHLKELIDRYNVDGNSSHPSTSSLPLTVTCTNHDIRAVSEVDDNGTSIPCEQSADCYQSAQKELKGNLTRGEVVTDKDKASRNDFSGHENDDDNKRNGDAKAVCKSLEDAHSAMKRKREESGTAQRCKPRYSFEPKAAAKRNSNCEVSVRGIPFGSTVDQVCNVNMKGQKGTGMLLQRSFSFTSMPLAIITF
jgi:hypothetical protein